MKRIVVLLILTVFASTNVEVNAARINNDSWSELLQKYVDNKGNVNYKGMKKELPKLISYLDQFKTISPDGNWSKNEKLAYWINLYNASTVYLVATNYPVKSIKRINTGMPWSKKFVKSGSKTYTLNDIEHKIIRPKFNDPRIHAALNCAAKSCPKLLNTAYKAETLDKQLDAQTISWINDSEKNIISPSKLKLSKLFDWYKSDFDVAGGVVKFVSKYNQSKVTINSKAKIVYLEYDWSLNE